MTSGRRISAYAVCHVSTWTRAIPSASPTCASRMSNVQLGDLNGSAGSELTAVSLEALKAR